MEIQTILKQLPRPATGQALTVSRPQNVGELAKLEKSLQEARIIHSPEETVKEVLRYCFVLVGLRAKNFPDEWEKKFLIEFIREYYGGHTPAEIRLAFEMAITGKLDVDPVCYENFSVVYFAGIMNAYRVWASDQVRKLEYLEPVERKLTADQIVDINIEFAFCKFQEINKLPIKK